MNKVGMFFSYWSNEWLVDFVAVAKRIAGLGFDIIELALPEYVKLPATKKEEFRAVTRDLGLGVTCAVGLKPEYDLASPDRSVRENGKEYVKQLLEECRFLDAPLLGGLNFCAWPAAPPPGMSDKRPYVERAAESVRDIIGVAEEYNIVYAIEVVNRFEQFLVNDAREGIEFCELVGSPYCQVHLDTFHMNIEEDTFRDAILRCKGRLGHFHIGEANRKPPRPGRMPWDDIFGALMEIGYEGPIVMEPFIKSGGEIGRNISVWRDISEGASDEQMDEMARESLDFVRGKLA